MIHLEKNINSDQKSKDVLTQMSVALARQQDLYVLMFGKENRGHFEGEEDEGKLNSMHFNPEEGKEEF